MAHSGWPAALLLAATTLALTPASRAAPDVVRSPDAVLDSSGTTYRTVELDPAAGRSPDAPGATTFAPVVGDFTMVGVTWTGDAPALSLRTHGADGWSAWQRLEPLLDGPDAGTEGDDLRATDLQWVGPSDQAQVSARGGVVPDDLHLTLIGTTHTAADERTARTAAQQLWKPRLRPHFHSRASWDADPALRTGVPTYNRTVQQVHVHHTVNSNDYRRRDVPGLLRGIYAYHTQALGWSDIGYNFLVDRFGRTWVGRAGGAAKAVRGAHTLGFNSTSTGVAVIGDYETARPGTPVLRALAHLAAWKLHRYHRHPRGRVWVYSHGSDLFAAGRTVHLPTIDGHRDTNQTACPGRYLYIRLPEVRKRAQERESRF